MKILVIAPWIPDATRPRSYSILRAIGESHEVRVIAGVTDRKGVRRVEEADPWELSTVRVGRFSALRRVAFGLLSGSRSLQQAYMNAPEFRRRISDEIRDFEPDLCYFNVLRTAQFSTEAGDTPLLIDLDEFRSAYYGQMAMSGASAIWRLIARWEARRMAIEESRVLRVFQRVLVSSPRDLRGDHANVHLVRSAHLMPEPPTRSPSDREHPRIVFVGRLSYRANHEAIVWFIRAVMPLIRERHPGVVLTVVGDSPKRSLVKLASHDVEVLGWVDDVSVHYSRADIAIVPVDLATGVQMKLIESLALGVPTVASRVVAAGAGLTDGEACLVASTPLEWAESVFRLLDDEALGRDLAEAGVAWVDREHSISAVMAAFADAVEEIKL